MIDRNSALGWWAGATGLVAAVVAVVLDLPALALLSGVAALVAGLVAVRLSGKLADMRAEVEVRAAEAAARPPEEPAAVATGDEAPAELESLDEYDSLEELEEGVDQDALTDHTTGLLNDRYFRVALEARISAARRHLRPVAVVLVDVVEGLHDQAQPRAADSRVVAAGIMKTLREADTACRLADGRFGLLLEDTPENGAVWTVERLRRNLAPEHPGFTMWAGVACYPAHAFGPDELFDRSARALEAAREWRQDRIEVATAE